MMKRIAAPLDLEEIKEFEEMELRDSYEELDLKTVAPDRGIQTGHGKHNVNVRPLGGNFGAGKFSSSAF